jgi:hypothetical protein
MSSLRLLIAKSFRPNDKGSFDVDTVQDIATAKLPVDVDLTLVLQLTEDLDELHIGESALVVSVIDAGGREELLRGTVDAQSAHRVRRAEPGEQESATMTIPIPIMFKASRIGPVTIEATLGDLRASATMTVRKVMRA